jgi:hypothetical protein
MTTMKQLQLFISISLLALFGLTVMVPFASADLEFEAVGARLTAPDGQSSRTAGAHPDLAAIFAIEKSIRSGPEGPQEGPSEDPRTLNLDLPPGLVGNPTVVSQCSGGDLANPGGGFDHCPANSQVGRVLATVVNGSSLSTFNIGLFNVRPGLGEPARFGFNYNNVVGIIVPTVRAGDYGISSGSLRVSEAAPVARVEVTLWGVPGDPSHDPERTNNGEPGYPSTLPRLPFMTNPTSCSETPLAFTFSGTSWQNPNAAPTEITTTTDPDGTPFVFDGCELLPFQPRIDVRSLSHATDAPTGLGVDLTVPQTDTVTGRTTAHVRRVVTTLPKGMSVSPSSADGLGACSLGQIGLGSNDAPTCPASSKLGTVTIETPLLDDPLEGDVILAKQNDNPFNSLLALYIAVKGPGFYLKLPGKVDADPDTGQLTVTFDNTPQLPFEKLHLAMRGGPRAALQTPMSCGTYNARAEFLSWATDEPVVSEIPMTFDQGCGTGGFNPKLNAGSADPVGGAFTAFNLQITRDDGETNLSRIEATLPEGVLAKLKGVALCPDAAAATSDCPASSQVGTTTVGAGPGSLPVYVPQPGKAPTAVYLGGPYKGAPLSLVVKVPAQAGPFDLGTVTVRNALQVDPTTAQVTAKSDPLPQILQGIPIAYRDVRVEVNRPDFTLNPTNCDQMKVTSVLISVTGQTATPSNPFQVAGCGELGFKPRLALKLSGQSKRSGNPSLRAVLKAPKGQANIAKTTVILPKTEFIDNAHISNPCTRVQFNAGACPQGSILGTARAFTPLLEEPLEGPVYFRSNGGDRELPDLVADLDGQIHVTLVGFIDAVPVKGTESSRVRTRFVNVPDAPVSKFVLRLFGGKRGLIANSVGLCRVGAGAATVQMRAQNAKNRNFQLPLGTSCGKAGKQKRKG